MTWEMWMIIGWASTGALFLIVSVIFGVFLCKWKRVLCFGKGTKSTKAPRSLKAPPTNARSDPQSVVQTQTYLHSTQRTRDDPQVHSVVVEKQQQPTSDNDLYEDVAMQSHVPVLVDPISSG
jgi:hypothetical protein